MVGGSNGGVAGDDRPQFPFVGPGSAPPPSLLPGACLLFLLCGHRVPASNEREDPSLSPAGWFRSLLWCLFRGYFVLWCPFPVGLGGSGLVHRVLGVWCVRCVVQLLVLLWVSRFRCRFEGRVATPVRWLVSGGVWIRQWSCLIPREPSGHVAHCRFCVCASVHLCVGAEDLQRCGVLFAEPCPSPWLVLCHYVLAMSVYDCPILHLRFVLRLR